MTGTGSEGNRRLFVAALLAGLFASVVSSGVITVAAVLDPASSLSEFGGPAGTVGFHFFGTIFSGVIWWVPYLLVVLLTVATPDRRTVTGGAIVLYGVELVFTWGTRQAFPGGTTIALYAEPLGTVVEFLALATVVWLAYHGGYERLTDSSGSTREHPLFAAVASGRSLRPGLSVHRAAIAVVPAAVLAAAGLVASNRLQGYLRDLASAGASAPSVQMSGGAGATVGVPVIQFPAELVLQASFLLAVLLVTGPGLTTRDLLKGLAVVFVVQSSVTLLPALVPPFETIALLSPEGPVMAPVPDVTALLAIAGAVWLAYQDGLAALRR